MHLALQGSTSKLVVWAEWDGWNRVCWGHESVLACMICARMLSPSFPPNVPPFLPQTCASHRGGTGLGRPIDDLEAYREVREYIFPYLSHPSQFVPPIAFNAPNLGKAV